MNQQKSSIHTGNMNAANNSFPNKLISAMQKESQNLPETPKYSIEERLKKLPGTKRTNCYQLCLHLEIHINTLYKWMGIKKGEKASIPVDTFYKIAEFLNCNPTDLINV